MPETSCCAPVLSDRSTRVYIPSEEQKFSLWEKVKITNDDGMIHFGIVTNIEMNYGGNVSYNYRLSKYLEKCTQDEMEKYFKE